MDKVQILTKTEKLRYEFIKRYSLNDMTNQRYEEWQKTEMNDDLTKYTNNWVDNDREEFVKRVDLVSDMRTKMIAIKDECSKLGLSGSDMHSQNVGWKEDGTLVFFDLGVDATDRKNKTLKPIVI